MIGSMRRAWRPRLLAGIALSGGVLLAVVLILAVPALAFAASRGAAVSSSFIHPGTISTVASTVPRNGDVNPYGVVVVPRSAGDLVQGDVLVSNFNNSKNLQGTGTTIVQISPSGQRHLFARIIASALPGACPGGIGLTTALTIISGNWVIVGSLPTTDGTSATVQSGCLIVLNSMGHVVETFSGNGINGPWDMTSIDRPNKSELFVTNVLNGIPGSNGRVVNKGTILRIDLNVAGSMPSIESITTIGSGFSERTDPAALIIGPTGVGLSANGTLYVADSLNNRIAAIPNALDRTTTAFTGKDISVNGALNDPLGLTMAPNGDILTVNGNDGNPVETKPSGAQVATVALDTTGSPPGAGTLFGLAVVPGGSGVYFVDDGSNTLNLLSL